MANPALTVNPNILPVQAYFNIDGSFNTFIGQGQPFTVSAGAGLSISDVSSLNATIYPTFSLVNTGSITSLDVSSTKVTFNPYTGIFVAPTFQGNLTGTASSATTLTGGSANSIVYQSVAGTTAYLTNGTTGQFLGANTGGAPTWQTISSGAATITDDTTTNATRYVGFTAATTGTLATIYTSSTKLQYNPSTGLFSATSYSGAWEGSTIGATYGGTGQSLYAVGDILYASTTTALSKLSVGSNGQVLTLAAGVPTWSAGSSGTVTSVSFTGGLISVATATTTPALTVAGTSGGIPYFSSTSTWATSSLLAASSLMIGGGAGAAPSTITTGTGVVTALGVNVGSAGAFVTFNGALGTPSSGTVTNLTGTASININGTVGATTATTGAFTTLAASSTVSGTGFTTYFASPPALGTTAPAEVKVTVGWAANTALTDAATVAWDTTNQVATFTFVSTNRTMGAPTNLKNGAFYALAVIQNGGSNTLTWNSVFKWASGTAPTLSTAASAKDYFTFRSDGTNLYQQGISQAVA